MADVIRLVAKREEPVPETPPAVEVAALLRELAAHVEAGRINPESCIVVMPLEGDTVTARVDVAILDVVGAVAYLEVAKLHVLKVYPSSGP